MVEGGREVDVVVMDDMVVDLNQSSVLQPPPSTEVIDLPSPDDVTSVHIPRLSDKSIRILGRRKTVKRELKAAGTPLMPVNKDGSLADISRLKGGIKSPEQQDEMVAKHRLHRERGYVYKQLIHDLLTEEEFTEIVKVAIIQAQDKNNKQCWRAREWLANYTMGKPIQLVAMQTAGEMKVTVEYTESGSGQSQDSVTEAAS